MSIARAAGEVHDALHALRRAVDVDAAVVGLTLEPHERLLAHRARGRELPLPRALLALREHRTDDLGDHVAGLAHDDGVADAHVLARDLVLVVQRRETDGRAADEHRLELRERRGPPGAADAHHDVVAARVVFSSGGNLYAIAQRGALAREAQLVALARGRRPSPPRRRSRSRTSGAAPPCCVAERVDRVEVAELLDVRR